MAELPTPTGRELEILKILWEQGPCSVRSVHRALAQDNPDLAYNTVQTLLRIMEDKELAAHHLEGRTFIYTACYSRDDSAARFLERVFNGGSAGWGLKKTRADFAVQRVFQRGAALNRAGLGEARRLARLVARPKPPLPLRALA